MNINLESTATIAKGISIKREKGAKDEEVVVAHLKFSGAFLQRDQLDELLGVHPGWCASFLFRDDGSPLIYINSEILGKIAIVTGSIKGKTDGPRAENITLAQAELIDMSFVPVNLGVLLSGHLVWPIAGDEAADIEPLLGQECLLRWVIQSPEQMELFNSQPKAA